MSSMFCTKIYLCKNADWCARDFNPKSDSPECFEPMTYGDQLRAKSDEELAEFLKKVGGCGPSFDKEYCNNVNGCPYGSNCWVEWLRQEAKA